MKRKLMDQLKTYKGYDKEEQQMVLDTLTYLENTEDYLGKINPKGHITGSSWIVNPTRDKVLLTHHFKLNIWVQLGGHTELDESVFESAYREGLEESGLKALKAVHHEIYDVDVHLIPERKGQEAHYHYDIRFLFEADDTAELEISDESHDVSWIEIKDIEKYTKARSVLRMVEKMTC